MKWVRDTLFLLAAALYLSLWAGVVVSISSCFPSEGSRISSWEKHHRAWAKERQDHLMQTVTYARDPATGLCFAFFDIEYRGYLEVPVSVPCVAGIK